MGDSFFILIIVLGALLTLSLLYMIISQFNRVRKGYRTSYTVLQVRVPKENESGPIVVEQIFATLHGIDVHFSFWERLKGYSSDHVSFEIASTSRQIKFYVAFPEHLRNLVEGQIYAQYPDVEIEDCPDYSYGSKFDDNVVSTEIKFTDPDVYPIKRYPQFEDRLARVTIDTMAGITASLVQFDNPEDQAWIQVVVTPLPDRWSIVFTKCV